MNFWLHISFWLQVFADLIPFFVTAGLVMLGTFIPALMRNGLLLVAYLVAVLVFAFGLHVYWVMQ